MLLCGHGLRNIRRRKGMVKLVNKRTSNKKNNISHLFERLSMGKNEMRVEFYFFFS